VLILLAENDELKNLALLKQIEYTFLMAPHNDLVNEYTALVTQFGMITFFSTVFPLAPLYAMFNNFLKILGETRKYYRKFN
jgi:hypothetical protein